MSRHTCNHLDGGLSMGSTYTTCALSQGLHAGSQSTLGLSHASRHTWTT